jgi:hypothetical protein
MHLALPFTLCASLVLYAAVAHAQDASAAQTALAAGELDSAVRLARAAVASGGATPRELVPLQLVLARAHALLGHEEEARTAFTWLLALEPGFRLESSAPDAVRSPYLEARGVFASHAAPLRTEVVLAEQPAALTIHVDDPAQLAARVRLRARLPGSAQFVEYVKLPERVQRIELPGLERASSVEVSVALLDEHGNRIHEQASDAAPLTLVVRPPAPERPQPQQAASATVRAVPDRSRAFYIGGGSTLAVAAGALAWAVVAHLERERLAERWNAGDCDGAGTTRAAVCADEHTQLARTERLASALYGVGGTALVTGLVLLTLAPRKRASEAHVARHELGCGAGPARWGVACSLRF